jgi:hypothetical protein
MLKPRTFLDDYDPDAEMDAMVIEVLADIAAARENRNRNNIFIMDMAYDDRRAIDANPVIFPGGGAWMPAERET